MGESSQPGRYISNHNSAQQVLPLTHFDPPVSTTTSHFITHQIFSSAMPVNDDDRELGAKNPWEARTEVSRWDGRRQDTKTPRGSTRSNRTDTTGHALTRENMSTLAQELKSEKRRKRERAAAESRRREREEASRRDEYSRRDTSTRPGKGTRADTGTVTRRSARPPSSQPSLNPPMISDQELSRNWTKVSETPTETVWTHQFRGGEREYRQKRYYRN